MLPNIYAFVFYNKKYYERKQYNIEIMFTFFYKYSLTKGKGGKS